MFKTPEHLFIDYLRGHGLSMTPQRKLIVETFLEADGHFSAEDLCALVRGKASDIGQATIYRTLKLLVNSGLADSFDTGESLILYERSYGHAHHDHLICMRCGKTVEVYDEDIEHRQKEVAQKYGFELTRHRMYLFGLWGRCQGQGQ